MSLVWPNGTTKEPARSDGYGPRRSIQTSAGWTRPFHAGTDHHSIGSLKAIGAGTVVQNSWISWAGWQIVIDLGVISGERTWVRYCHLAAQSPVKVGQRVARGQTVGTEGATGQVVGRHLHWEIYRGRIDRGDWGDSGTTVDPRSFVSARLVKPGKKGLSVKHYHREDRKARNKGRALKPREHLYLSTLSNPKNSNATNCVGGIGPYTMTAHIYAKGEPGEAVDVVYMWQKSGKNSHHYSQRFVFDKSGSVIGNVTFQRAVTAGQSVFLKAVSPSSNTKPVTVNLLDSDAYLIK